MSWRRRLAIVLAGAAGFGLLMAVIKGQGAGARDALGNISAPWLLLSFLAGSTFARVRVAALLGLVAALAALAAFYAGESVILDLGPHSWLTDLNLTMRAGGYYFIQGLVSGPIFGALGGLWARRRSATVGVVPALLFALEPLIVLVYQRSTGGSPTEAGLLTHYPWMWATEVLAGVAAVTLIVRRRIRRAQDI